ncbi:MAG: hypothetical protein HDR88_17570 [Bacteroides sp.]|nr:hypothetical protein [Bacteroides sp.]
MKKLHLILMFAVLMLTTACSDNHEGIKDNLSKHVIGKYEGYTSASCAYFSGNMNADQVITVTEGSENNKVNIQYVSSTWGTVTVADAVVVENEQGYVVSGNGKWSMGHNGSINDYDCTVTGRVKSGEAQFIFSAPAVMGGLKVEFTEGEVPASLILPGTYEGWTDASCAYFQGMTADNQIITIVGKDNVYSVSYESDTWGTFTIEELTFTYSDGVFTISGDGICKMGMDGDLKDYPCTLSGSIDVEKSVPSFIFNVPAVMGGLSITFSSGDMPSESTDE